MQAGGEGWTLAEKNKMEVPISNNRPGRTGLKTN